MNLHLQAGNSLIFYTGKNYAGTSLNVEHGDSGILASGSNSWNYQSAAMNAMHSFCWSEVNTADTSIDYQNHIESLVTANIADLTSLYPSPQFPLSYLGVDPSLVTLVWLDMNAVADDSNAVASTSLVGNSTTSITTLSRVGVMGALAFVGTTTGSSAVSTCSYGSYNSGTGQVNWTGMNAGTIVLEYTGGAVSVLSATGFPDEWTFASPTMQSDGSWVIAVSANSASDYVISDLTTSKDTIVNDGTDQAQLTAIVRDSAGNTVEGVTVNWVTNLGVLNHQQQDTDSSGTSHAKLTDTGDSGVAKITASLSNGSSMNVKVTIESASGELQIVSVSSDKTSIENNNTDTATITALVQDAENVPAAGVTVHWASTLGTLTANTSVTDDNGLAVTGLKDNGDTGEVVVTASLDDGSQKTVTITLTDDTADLIIASLTSDKYTIVNNGSDKATLTATVHDAQGNIVEGVLVNWSATKGFLSQESQETNSEGQSTVTFTDNGDTGTVNVTASLENGQSATVNISLTTGNLIIDCSTGAPLNIGAFESVMPTNKVATYGVPGSIVNMTVSGEAKFKSTGFSYASITLDSTGYGLAEVYDTAIEKVTVFASSDYGQEAVQMEFVNTSDTYGVFINDRTPADGKTPCGYYWYNYIETSMQATEVIIYGNAKLPNNSNKESFVMNSDGVISFNITDSTEEVVMVYSIIPDYGTDTTYVSFVPV